MKVAQIFSFSASFLLLSASCVLGTPIAAPQPTPADVDASIGPIGLEAQTLRVALSWKKFIETKKWNALIALAAPGATYWFSGVTDPSAGPLFNPFAGTTPFVDRVNALSGLYPPTFRLDIFSQIIKGDTIFLEINASGEGPGQGQVYKNTVSTRITQRNGKITSVREYLDIGAVQLYFALGQ